MNICRTCLAEDVEKDVRELPNDLNGVAYAEVMLFCLNIEIEPDPKMTTKLCMKCYMKIVSFHQFKIMALQSDSYLRSQEISYTKDELDLSDNDDARSEQMVYLEDLKLEVKIEENFEVQSNDELLSDNQYENNDEDSKIDKENDSSKKYKIKLKKRIRKKEADNGPKICDECGKTVRNLKQHMYLHKPVSVRKRYKCKDAECDKLFSSYSARLRHYKIKHLGIKKHCDICNKDVICLKNHRMLVHQEGTPKYECATCGRKFPSRGTRDQHILIHSKERPIKCEQCDKTFKTNMTLQLHVRQVHEKEKTHLCQYCSKSFFKKYHLQVHIRSHLKEKPFPCPDCGKFFGTRSILKNHRLVHSDEKKYSCDLCNMTFMRPGYLKNHMISHTKEKRYSCKYCGVRFGRSDHRLRHERTAHERNLPGTFDVFNETENVTK